MSNKTEQIVKALEHVPPCGRRGSCGFNDCVCRKAAQIIRSGLAQNDIIEALTESNTRLQKYSERLEAKLKRSEWAHEQVAGFLAAHNWDWDAVMSKYSERNVEVAK